MTILTVQHIKKSFGIDEVLKDVVFAVNEGERIGLVGVNGSGKTTLLRILRGEIPQDDGNISVNKGLKIGYMSQVFSPRPGNTVLREAEEALAGLFAIEDKIRDLEHKMGGQLSPEMMQRVLNEYARLTERFEREGGYQARSQVMGVLMGLGLRQDQHHQMASTLSGGELTRLGLTKLLLQKPDLLLLDEPTNHLDMEALRWLETYLAQYSGSVIVVSHDRYFLDAVCTDMAELLFGKLEMYHGNYSAYIKQRDERFGARRRMYQLQQKEIVRQKAIIARFRSFNREKSIRAAESREKALERMDILEKPEEEHQIMFRFEAKRHIGDIALKAEDLKKAFEQKSLFEHLSFLVKSGDRAALIGPNGIGKTTLLKCLMGRETLDEGVYAFGAGASVGYYDQRQMDLDPEKDVLTEVWDAFPALNQSQIRGALGLFLFSGDDVFTPISLLSGGERSRVSLAKLMLKKNNFLLLDEPTNHLDADSREALEAALSGYTGVILAVSHDRYFINRFANRVLVMDESGITSYDGNYDDYQSSLAIRDELDALSAQARTKTEIIKERKAGKQLEEKLMALEENVKRAEEAALETEALLNEARRMQANPDVYANPAKAAEQAALVNDLTHKLEKNYKAWEEAESARLEEATDGSLD